MPISVSSAAIDMVLTFLKERVAPSPHGLSEAKANIERHLREVLNWSSRIQFYGMARAEETDHATISLRLASEPRRFTGSLRGNISTEEILLADERNYLLLGDPGAGKTTTLKRLARRMLLQPPTGDSDVYQFPVVIRLRELRSEDTIVEAIASALGFTGAIRRDTTGSKIHLWLGDVKLESAILKFLDSYSVLLLIDGLDEVPNEGRERMRRELSWLALNTTASKVVASCRSGDYTSVIEGFDLLEICPLEQREIAQIAGAWLGNPEDFLQKLATVPYQDIVDRPLLLTQLLYLYQRYGYLPEQPTQVYRRMIGLLLNEWDAERGVVRRSKYSGFDPDRKAAFLSALAYHLTFRVRKRVFTEAELISAYASIHERFGLPRQEAKQVIEELESHTGIIAVAGPETFEFSHLSIQEYLCADYMIREPLAENLSHYMDAYPAPVAVAVALSSNASRFFAGLFLREVQTTVDSLHSFLSRLLLERPFFGVSALLGAAVGRLYRDAVGRAETIELLNQLIELPNVAESLSAALDSYFPAVDAEGMKIGLIRLNRVRPLNEIGGVETPDWIYAPAKLLESFARSGNLRAQHFQPTIRNLSGV